MRGSKGGFPPAVVVDAVGGSRSDLAFGSDLNSGQIWGVGGPVRANIYITLLISQSDPSQSDGFESRGWEGGIAYLRNLLDLILALQQRFLGQQFSHDTPHTPHIDLGAVFLCPQEEFRGPVPEGHDELGEFRGRIAIVAGHAEVGDFELAAVVEEEVGGFEVAVHDPLVVEKVEAREELEEEGFDFAGEEGFGHFVEEGFEVVFVEVHY